MLKLAVLFYEIVYITLKKMFAFKTSPQLHHTLGNGS